MAQQLYGEITPEMNNFDKIRERIKARLLAMNYPSAHAFEYGKLIAMRLEGAGITDDQLQQANVYDFSDFVLKAFGEPDHDYTRTLQEAYGKVAA